MLATSTDVAAAHSDVDRASELSVHVGNAMQHKGNCNQISSAKMHGDQRVNSSCVGGNLDL